jgi:hypothetical protein
MGLFRYHRLDAKSPLVWIAAAALAVRLVGLGWGLPASDAWDNDGIAPRDFWPGLIETFTPGHYFTYPPAHLALLALLTAPVTAVVLLRAPALTPAAVMGEALKVPYMTAFSLAARGVAAAMSIGIIFAVAGIAREAAGRRAAVAAAAVGAVNATLTYYAHTSNLDVPYLFWASLALLELARSVARDEPRRLRGVCVAAALAVASKDQAYAIFLLGVPAAIAAAIALGVWRGPRLRQVLGEGAIGAGIGAAILAVVDGAIVNPSGFAARVRFLSGPASAPFAYYPADLGGRAHALIDTLLRFGEHYPLPVALLAAAGLARAPWLPRGGARAAALVPGLAIASYTVMFNCVALRTEQRFLLPQMALWAAYAGIGIDWALSAADARGGASARGAVLAACTAVLGWGLFRCLDVDANLVLDPRYDAEHWLEANVAPGDVLEVEGRNVYLPLLPPQAHVIRVGPEPVDTRNPLYGAEERREPLMNVGARAPRWIVVAAIYARSYLAVPGAAGAWGRARNDAQIQASLDPDAVRFFQGLQAGTLGYRLVHTSTWTSGFWPRLDLHGSLAQDQWIYERATPPEGR